MNYVLWALFENDSYDVRDNVQPGAQSPMAKDNFSNLISALLAFIQDDRKNTNDDPELTSEIETKSRRVRGVVIYVFCILSLAYSANLVGVDKLVVHWISQREIDPSEGMRSGEMVHYSQIELIADPLREQAEAAEAEVALLQDELGRARDKFRRLQHDHDQLLSTVKYLRERLGASKSAPPPAPPLYERLFEGRDP